MQRTELWRRRSPLAGRVEVKTLTSDDGVVLSLDRRDDDGLNIHIDTPEEDGPKLIVIFVDDEIVAER